MMPEDRLEEAIKQLDLAAEDLEFSGVAAGNCQRAQGAAELALRQARQAREETDDAEVVK